MINDKDMIELSTLHAYAYYEQGTTFTVNENTYYVEQVYNEKTGLKAGVDAMLVKNQGGEYALIYTGSDRKNDFMKDWVIANGSNALKLPILQYIEGLKVYDYVSKDYEVSRVGGVSLGGGIATFIGIHRENCNVVSINPSPQYLKMKREYTNILTLTDRNDILYKVSTWYGRSKNQASTITFFNRGNNFVENIKLNHVGYDKARGLYLDDSIPYDLLTGNLKSSGYIDINPEDILHVNNNFKTYLSNSNDELIMNVLPGLNIRHSYRNNKVYQNIIHSIIDGAHSYMVGCLPTLNSYFDFKYIFDEIKELVTHQSYYILDELLNTIITSLNLDYIYNQIEIDSKNGIKNVENTNLYLNDVTKSTDTLINNIILKDNLQAISNPYCLNEIKIVNNHHGINLKYFFLIAYAKETVYTRLKPTIISKFKVIDFKIDFVIGALKLQVDLIGNITKLISKELAEKISILEQILSELYHFDIGEAVYSLFIICIEEIIAIVIPKDLEDKLSSLKYLSGIFNNIHASSEIYTMYLSNFYSDGISVISNSISSFNKEFKQYNNYLNSKYN